MNFDFKKVMENRELILWMSAVQRFQLFDYLRVSVFICGSISLYRFTSPGERSQCLLFEMVFKGVVFDFQCQTNIAAVMKRKIPITHQPSVV